jgi:AP-1 complex subunit beta-1
MDPLGKIQVAVKNSLDVLYYSTNVPFHLYLAEDGQLRKSRWLWCHDGGGFQCFAQDP